MAADSTGLVGNSNVLINLRQEKDYDLDTGLDPLIVNTGVNWSFGTGANQANLLWHNSRSTDDTGETINVYDGGVEKTVFGTDLTMEALKLLYVKNTHASDIVEIPPGGFFLWVCPTAAGIDVTTNKNLKLASKAAGTVTYDIVMLGLD